MSEGKYFDVVFDAPPGSECGRFVETEDHEGKGISRGEWVERDDGYWALRFPTTMIPNTPDPAAAVARWRAIEEAAIRYKSAVDEIVTLKSGRSIMDASDVPRLSHLQKEIEMSLAALDAAIDKGDG